MIDANFYPVIFNYLICLLVFISIVQLYQGSFYQKTTIDVYNVFGFWLVVGLSIFVGLRPLDAHIFGDTQIYNWMYNNLAHGIINESGKMKSEWLFYGGSELLARSGVSNVYYFLLLSFLYFGINFLTTKKIFGNKYYLPLLVMMFMFTFFSSAVNGIRAGLSLSILLMAFAYRKNLSMLIVVCLTSFYIQNSSAIVIFAGVVAYFINNPKFYIIVWLLTIVGSLILGDSATNLMLTLGVADERFESYLTGAEDLKDSFSSIGFRWDFLLYSALPVLVAYYWIFKRHYTDKIYIWMFGTYILSNCFWIMVIRAAFSNRFAMLSWSIMPLVLIYPYMKQNMTHKHQQFLAISIFVFYLFTFYSFIILPIIS